MSGFWVGIALGAAGVLPVAAWAVRRAATRVHRLEQREREADRLQERVWM
jgi:hypothetical protein